MFLEDTCTCPILGPLVPLFWISSDISSALQSQSGSCLIHFCGGACNVHSLRFTSGATPANLLMASTKLITLLMFVSADVGIGLGSNKQPSAQKTNALSLDLWYVYSRTQRTEGGGAGVIPSATIKEGMGRGRG